MQKRHRKDTDQSVQCARLETKLVEIVVAELQWKIDQIHGPDKPDEGQDAQQVFLELKFHGNFPSTRFVELNNAMGNNSDQIVSSNNRSRSICSYASGLSGSWCEDFNTSVSVAARLS